MFVIGIDVSKYKRNCIALNDAVEVARKQSTIANDRSGFNQLLPVINELDPSQEKRIRFESAGHYQGNLVTFLEGRRIALHGAERASGAPLQGARTHRGTKTDKTDALLIA